MQRLPRRLVAACLALVACIGIVYLAARESPAHADAPVFQPDADIPSPAAHRLKVLGELLNYDGNDVAFEIELFDTAGVSLGRKLLHAGPGAATAILNGNRSSAANAIAAALGVSGGLVDAGP